MAFRLKSNETLKQGVVRAIREQAERSLDGLSGGDSSLSDDSFSEAVHRARVCCKRIRAILLLVRPALDRIYDVENDSFRIAARMLSELRDSNATIEAVHRLGARYRDKDTQQLVDRLCRYFVNQSELKCDPEEMRWAIEAFSSGVNSAVARIPSWSAATHGYSKAVKMGLLDTYFKGRKACKIANSDPSDDNLHEWRKWVKALMYQVKFLQPSKGRRFHRDATQLGELAEVLGHANDLIGLRESVASLPNQHWKNRELDRFLAALHLERARLHSRALTLGRILYVKKPKVRNGDF